jgi:hypothetical protein
MVSPRLRAVARPNGDAVRQRPSEEACLGPACLVYAVSMASEIAARGRGPEEEVSAQRFLASEKRASWSVHGSLRVGTTTRR